MVSIYTVDTNALIAKVAQELKKSDIVHPAEWAKFVKTGIAKQRPPVDEDWWYVRAASILRSVYKLGPIGVSKLRTKYGSKQNRGVRPEKFRDASGNIIRTILQQLEKEGLIMQSKDKRKGRVITPKGQSLLEKSASSLADTKSKTKKVESKKEEAKEEQPKKVEAKEEAKKETPKKEEKVEVKEEQKETPKKEEKTDDKETPTPKEAPKNEESAEESTKVEE